MLTDTQPDNFPDIQNKNKNEIKIKKPELTVSSQKLGTKAKARCQMEKKYPNLRPFLIFSAMSMN